MKTIALLLCLLSIAACSLGNISFEEVSLPYLDEYGDPNKVLDLETSQFWYWYFETESLVVFFSTSYEGDWEVISEETFYTFAQISQPYLDQYGPPEEINEYTSSDYHSIDWWWWSKGFQVTFLWTTYDDIRGWTVDSTYSFSPIY